MIKETWGERLKEVFLEIQDPIWQKSAKNIFEINSRGHYYVDTAHTLKVSAPETWF